MHEDGCSFEGFEYADGPSLRERLDPVCVPVPKRVEAEGLVPLLGNQQGVVTAQQGLEDVFASDTSVQDSEGVVLLAPRVQGRAQEPARHLGESLLVQI
ncbi:hypothetical protein NGM37_25685, partial [Streptomyces sp. TRM76130]|nr:hypothetical protein [Streptomyces sp. TRM76130]